MPSSATALPALYHELPNQHRTSLSPISRTRTLHQTTLPGQVDAELIGLDVSQRMAELSDGSSLPYDLLLVTSGLQEQTRTRLGESDPEVVGMVVNAQELRWGLVRGCVTGTQVLYRHVSCDQTAGRPGP